MTLSSTAEEFLPADDSQPNMVSLTRLDGTGITIHALHIVTVESTPNTLLWLHNGGRLMVRETIDEVSEGVAAWSRRIACPLPPLAPANPATDEAR